MNKKYLWALLILVIASLACSLTSMGSDDGEINDTTENSSSDAGELPGLQGDTYDATVKDSALLEPVPLSPAQAQVLGARRQPNRFLLQFTEGIRQETWHYDRLGYEVTFRNGEIYAEREFEVAPGDAIFYSIYAPWQFNQQMGLSELIAISQSETFAYEPFQEVFEEDLSIAYLKGLDVGFRGDQVLYIRTIPLGEGAREGSPGIVIEQPTTIEIIPTATAASSSSSPTLTPEEQAHHGTHNYHIRCNYSDGYSEDFYEERTWEFTDEGLYIDGDGPIPPRNIDNFYGFSDEDLNVIFTIEAESIREDAGFYEEDDDGNPVYIAGTCIYTLSDD